MNRHTHPAGDSRAEHAAELAQDARDAASDEADVLHVTTADGLEGGAT